MPKIAVISGRVMDETGQPIANVTVLAPAAEDVLSSQCPPFR
jgi:hypothetical protein